MNIEISPKEYERFLNWDDAMLYCQLLTIDNKNDWRLPTKDELNEIFDSEELNKMYNSKNVIVGDYYWSSSEYCQGSNYALAQNMVIGTQYNAFKDTVYYVRAIRDIL